MRYRIKKMYRSCGVCGEIPKYKKTSICGGCMDSLTDWEDQEKFGETWEVKMYRKKLAILSWIIFAEMLFITLYEYKNFYLEYAYAEVDGSVLQMTNEAREKKLRKDECLDRLATDRAKFLYENKYFDHITPDGTTPWQFIEKCGDYRYAGENLASGYDDKVEMHRALMNSPLHRENIENKKFKKFGFGCYEYICVEFFKS